jgi:hypothetical protein
MSLVKCNHCNKETVNNTGKCRWCNKELDKNLDNIEREINSTVKKQPLAEKDNFNWICDECNEENEPLYDVCWNCSAESEIAKTKYNELNKKLEKDKVKKQDDVLKNQEIKELEIQIEKSMKKYKWISRIIAILSVSILAYVASLILNILFDIENSSITPSNWLIFAYILLWILFGIWIYSKLYHKYRVKIIKELGLENHKHYNQIK